MRDNESAPGPAEVVDRSDLPGDPSAWELPPAERRLSEVAEPTAIVEDVHSEVEVAALPAIEPRTEIAPREVPYPAVRALLTISLEPEWPGNVHRYEIMINPCDGSFTGVAHSASNIAGETISGAFNSEFTEIDFTAVYPAPAYHYAWFASGPLGSFRGMDSRGNILNTVSGTIAKPAKEVAAALTVVEPPREEVDPPAVEVPVVAEAVDEVDEVAVTEPDVVVAEPEVEPEVDPEVEPEVEPEAAAAAEDVTVEAPPDEAESHPAGCQCLACRWGAFKPIPVTEGPLAGHAFYFGSTQPPLQPSPQPEPSAAEDPAVPDPVAPDAPAARPEPRRGKRRQSRRSVIRPEGSPRS